MWPVEYFMVLTYLCTMCTFFFFFWNHCKCIKIIGVHVRYTLQEENQFFIPLRQLAIQLEYYLNQVNRIIF